jgi:multidrug efflux system membrane fusion protein
MPFRSRVIRQPVRNALIGTAIAAVLLAVPDTITQAENSAPAAQATPVSVARIEAREATTWDEFSGRLEAVERVEIRSRVSGAVEKIHFREGALVKEGDLLFTIDPAPYAAEVDRLEAQVAAAEARVVFTKAEVARGKQLLGNRNLSERDVEQRINAYKEAEANLRAAKAALQSARLNLGYTQVRAPVAGRVGRIEITIGNLVEAGPGAPVLTKLVSVDPIYASFNANEDAVTRALATLSAEASANAELDRIPVEMATAASPDAWTPGRLQLIDNQVDANSGTVRVRATFRNPGGRLIAGQFVKVRMARPRSGPAVLITERAIGTDQDKKFVLVVDKDNKATYREIKLGAMADKLRIVTSGLKAGERIIVNGLQRVRPGDVVAPQIVEMNASQTAQAQAQHGSSKVAQQ